MIRVNPMATKTDRKANIQKELKKIQTALKGLQKDFKRLQKQAGTLKEKVYTRSDEKEAQKLRRLIASK